MGTTPCRSSPCMHTGRGLCSGCLGPPATPPIRLASRAAPVALRHLDSVAISHGVRLLLVERVAQRLASMTAYSEEVQCAVNRVESRLQAVDRSLRASGGGMRRLAEAEKPRPASRSSCAQIFFHGGQSHFSELEGKKLQVDPLPLSPPLHPSAHLWAPPWGTSKPNMTGQDVLGVEMVPLFSILIHQHA